LIFRFVDLLKTIFLVVLSALGLGVVIAVVLFGISLLMDRSADRDRADEKAE
jgi:hypothetical protein